MSSRRHPDHRSPWVLEIHDLTRRPGTMKEFELEVPAPAGVGIELIAVPEGSPVELNLRAESVVEGVLVTGSAAVELHGECARCLRDVDYGESFDLQELFFYPGRDADEDAPVVVEDSVDLEGVFRDAVVLELPFTPLCRADCLGLCPSCGFNLNDEPDHSHDEPIDPRWAALAGLN